MKRWVLLVVLAGCNRGLPLAEAARDPEPAPILSLDGAVAMPPDLGRQPSRERCNGEDDDLDGKVDEGCPIRLTTDEGGDQSPSVDGGRVAWLRAPVDAHDFTFELWLRDLGGGPERRLATAVTSAPSLSGTRVAFARNTQLFVLDIDSGVETLVKAPVPGRTPTAPSLDGNYLAWAQRNEGGVWVENDDSYVYDIAQDYGLQIAPHPFGQRRPLVEGTRVVWADDREGHHTTAAFTHLFDLYVADLAANAIPVALTHRSGGWTVSMPQAFEGGRVAIFEQDGWEDYQTLMTRGTCGLVLYDVRDGKRREIDPPDPRPNSDCVGLSDEGAVALEGKLMVVERNLGGSSDLELIDLESNVRRAVTDYPRKSMQPRLAGGVLVWQDDRNDHFDLYMMDLRDLDAGDFFPEGRDP